MRTELSLDSEIFTSKKEVPVVLVSSDGTKFVATKTMAILSDVIKEMLDDDDEDDEVQEIKLNVSSTNLDKILEYCEYQSNTANNRVFEIEKPIRTNKIEEIINVPWYSEYLNNLFSKGIDSYSKIITDVNYLNITFLLHLLCARLAADLKGKTPEEIKKQFNIPENAVMNTSTPAVGT